MGWVCDEQKTMRKHTKKDMKIYDEFKQRDIYQSATDRCSETGGGYDAIHFGYAVTKRIGLK